MRAGKVTNMRTLIREQIESLVKESEKLLSELGSKDGGNFNDYYQIWYTQALPVIKQLLPERIKEFTTLYDDPETVLDIAGYLLEETDILKERAIMNFIQQYHILESTKYRLDNILTNIQELIQSEILDSELDAATELLKAGHLRASGTLAGVVLERHLAKVCSSRSLKSSKKNPTIADWNDILKDASIYDIPTWRSIQYLADIRNLCAHAKNRDPKKDEVDELIRGVERITKTII